MRIAATVLVGLFLLGGSAFAADAKRPQGKIIVASVDAKQIKAAPARSANPAASRAKGADQGDSRLNGYRLEQESCCGSFSAP